IVTEPDIRSPEEARLYLVKLRSILRYLGVSTGNMEEGALRCDANISLRPKGDHELGTKVEVKNMNSFRSVYRALEYETQRQREALERGERLAQETRGWVDAKGITVSQRSKEYAHDYRYFPEPDLPPLFLSRDWVEAMRAGLPELPDAKRDRFIQQYGLTLYLASLLVEDRALADFFESGAGRYPNATNLANWITGELFRLLNTQNIEIAQSRVSPERLVELLTLIDKGALSGNQAKEVLEEMFASGRPAMEIAAERGLAQISDTAQIEGIVAQVIANNPQSVADYRNGKAPALDFLVGQVMKATRGKANPGLAKELLRSKLEVG
ncbi:MAG: Asp-tRNA(Asn)/Glu-tRNA(Gln) amidotransferase subunit GatB, partial [Chloroflexi bacterium]|nr:Asp-tRNA(Asn)/Glu-tRNA(Gln) amidotransferase subunit GatB [Chloroflexota bacterium]